MIGNPLVVICNGHASCLFFVHIPADRIAAALRHCPGSLSLIPIDCCAALHTINLQLISTIRIGMGCNIIGVIGGVCSLLRHSYVFASHSFGKGHTVCLMCKMSSSHCRAVNCTVIYSLRPVCTSGTRNSKCIAAAVSHLKSTIIRCIQTKACALGAINNCAV